MRLRLAGSTEELEARLTDARAARQAMWDERIAEGDYVAALYVLGSEQVAEAIVDLSDELDDSDLRAVLREHWDRCDGGGTHRAELLELFRRAGYVTDTGRTFTGEISVYRGNLGEDPFLGLSWTLSKARARWFALYAFDSSRAAWLGLSRADGEEPVPTVWRGVVRRAGNAVRAQTVLSRCCPGVSPGVATCSRTHSSTRRGRVPRPAR